MIWPLALIAEALTEVPQNSERRIDLLKMIIASDTGNHWLHDSFNADEVSIFTRADFGRPNALFAEFLMQVRIGRKALPLSFIDDLHYGGPRRAPNFARMRAPGVAMCRKPRRRRKPT